MISKRFFSSFLKVPIIDLSQFQTNSQNIAAKLQVATQIQDACEKYGLFLIKNEGNKKAISSIKEFFSLPDAEKNSLKSMKSLSIKKGYIGIGEESGSDSYEIKEGFSYGYDWPLSKPAENPLQSPNIWPKNPPFFQKDCEETFKNFCSISKILNQCFSLSLGYEENYLWNFCSKGHTISLMRLFHYLPYSFAPKEVANMRKIGSSEHTDWGFLTIIQQEEKIPGLQVFHQGEWLDIEPIENTLVVNCGDYLSLLTNKKFISPLHRVVHNERERISIVFFFYPDYEARIPRIGEGNYSLFKDQKKGSGVKWEDIENKSFGEYIMEKWRQVEREGKMY